MIEDAADGLGLGDEADHAHGAGASGTEHGIGFVDTAEQISPSLARGRGVRGRSCLGISGLWLELGVLASPACSPCGARVEAMIPDQVLSWRRDLGEDAGDGLATRSGEKRQRRAQRGGDATPWRRCARALGNPGRRHCPWGSAAPDRSRAAVGRAAVAFSAAARPSSALCLRLGPQVAAEPGSPAAASCIGSGPRRPARRLARRERRCGPRIPSFSTTRAAPPAAA